MFLSPWFSQPKKNLELSSGIILQKYLVAPTKKQNLKQQNKNIFRIFWASQIFYPTVHFFRCFYKTPNPTWVASKSPLPTNQVGTSKTHRVVSGHFKSTTWRKLETQGRLDEQFFKKRFPCERKITYYSNVHWNYIIQVSLWIQTRFPLKYPGPFKLYKWSYIYTVIAFFVQQLLFAISRATLQTWHFMCKHLICPKTLVAFHITTWNISSQ